MMKKNIILDKSFEFALEIVALCENLNSQKEFVLSKQLLRLGTSIGAQVEEAIGAQSRSDFIHKFSIAYKEARETKYWLRLLKKSQKVNSQIAVNLINKVEETLRMICTIIKTTKYKSS